MVLAAIRDDRHYILPHSEFRDSFRAKTDAILAAFSDEAPTSDRIEGMRLRAIAFGDFWDDGGPSTEEI